MRRERNFTLGESLLHLFESRVKNAARVDDLTLIRRPGAELRTERTGVKIFFGFFAGSFFYAAFDSNLPLDFHPIHHQRGVWILVELLALFAGIISEENKPTFIEVFEQDNARERFFIDAGRKRHCVGIMNSGFDGSRKPGVELVY